MLELKNVSYRYPNSSAPALHDISLRVNAGEFVVLAGGSGSGKSTLLRAASALVPHHYGGEFTGSLQLGELTLRYGSVAEFARVVGCVFQDPETQVIMGSVRSELSFSLENVGMTRAAVARGVEETALALGIGHLLDRSPDQLSGGELQRVALAAALVRRPSLLLLDEPTSQLDPVAGDELLSLLRRLNEEWGTTIIVAEHRLERLLAAADRVVVLEDGRMVCDSEPREFLTWAGASARHLQTPAARLFRELALSAPLSVKEARKKLQSLGVLPQAGKSSERESDARNVPTPSCKSSEREGDARNVPTPSCREHARNVPTPSCTTPVADDPRANARWGRDVACTCARWGRDVACTESHEHLPLAIQAKKLWYEFDRGPVALKAVSINIRPGERIALLGRNGAGKSTLLKIFAGLISPTRGRINTSGRVALLLQNPGDYFIAERVGDEVSEAALEEAGLAALADQHPSDLSGGERQRLALAIVLQGETAPHVVCLDEPTRGMGRDNKAALIENLNAITARGIAAVLSTHDIEFAAEFADRVILLGDGELLADAPATEVLSGGTYFTTETARILHELGGPLNVEAARELLRVTVGTRGTHTSTVSA